MPPKPRKESTSPAAGQVPIVPVWIQGATDVIVPDHQLSLAIGREGQNARLAARLTGVRVDIRSETQLAEGIPAGGRDADVEYADGEWVANAETGEMEWHAADGSVISQSEWAEQNDTGDVASGGM